MTTPEQNQVAKARWGAAILVIAPMVLLAGLVWHPWIGDPGDAGFLATLAEAVAAGTTRWALSHLTVAVGSGLLVLAFLAVRSYLRAAGEERWSALAVPFIVIGSTLFTLLPGMEFAPVAAAEAGHDIQAAQAALDPWFFPVLLIGAVTFALGALGFAMGIVRSGALSSRLTWLVVGGLVVMAASRFVPLAAVQFYVQGAAGIVALWPLAYVMWKHPEARLARQVAGAATRRQPEQVQAV